MMRVSILRPAFGAALIGGTVFLVGAYFTFSAVQGEFGVVRRVQISAEKQTLIHQRDVLKAEVVRMQNLTLRLSDEYLDLDLLDEQARDVLGYVRADEIVFR